MRQLINISRTLTKKCPVLLFDEPLKALDKSAKEILFEIFNELRKDHLVLTTSHEELTINSDRLPIKSLIKYSFTVFNNSYTNTFWFGNLQK